MGSLHGHWEGDLIIGTDGSAIGTLVERTIKVTKLLHLPPLNCHGIQPLVKNGPVLAGQEAQTTRKVLATQMGALPATMRKALTWDRGKELSQHGKLIKESETPVYFAVAHRPWQRPLNENTNGPLEWSPKGRNRARWNAAVYTSSDFLALVGRLGMRSSMGRAAACWDNSMAESFFSMLIMDLVYAAVSATKSQARCGVTRYVEGFYNSKRRQSGLSCRVALTKPNMVGTCWQRQQRKIINPMSEIPAAAHSSPTHVCRHRSNVCLFRVVI
jgi:hypothetical protein